MMGAAQQEGKSGLTRTQAEKLCRVGFYIRVSTDRYDQQNSFENQRRACLLLLKQHPEYRLVKIFQDEGISGTQAKKRPGFMDMIRAAEQGLLDLIITKSLSRWSRNTLESLLFVRKLQELGCDLVFERENIDTRQQFSEFLLTLYSAFSQEESRSISENTKIGIRMNFKLGKVRWCPLYGYRRGYVVDEAQAAVVREIFARYEAGESLGEIRDRLKKRGIPTPRQGQWRACQLQQMLRNCKYAGDLLLQKYYTKDHLAHRAVRNDGSLVPMWHLKDHHEPLVSREQFQRVQELLSLRRYNAGGSSRRGNPVAPARQSEAEGAARQEKAERSENTDENKHSEGQGPGAQAQDRGLLPCFHPAGKPGGQP